MVDTVVVDKATTSIDDKTKTGGDGVAADKASDTTQTPEQKAAADKATADAAAAAAASGRKDGTDSGQPKPPDKYALKAPDDADWFTDRDMKRAETRAREHGLTNEQAQAMLDEQITYRDAIATEFLTETTADKDYGGPKLAASQALANRVIERVRPVGHPRATSFRQFMDRSAAGNNLEVLSFLADLGKLMDEDSPASGQGGSGPKKKDPATVLYGEDKS